MACDANASQVLVSQVKVDSQSRTQLYHTGLGRSEFVGKQNSIMESNVRTVNIQPIHSTWPEEGELKSKWMARWLANIT